MVRLRFGFRTYSGTCPSLEEQSTWSRPWQGLYNTDTRKAFGDDESRNAEDASLESENEQSVSDVCEPSEYEDSGTDADDSEYGWSEGSFSTDEDEERPEFGVLEDDRRSGKTIPYPSQAVNVNMALIQTRSWLMLRPFLS